ncbi:hypothetical protein GCM10027093_54070 [Paraburkholderia jirisanensis]
MRVAARPRYARCLYIGIQSIHMDAHFIRLFKARHRVAPHIFMMENPALLPLGGADGDLATGA